MCLERSPCAVAGHVGIFWIIHYNTGCTLIYTRILGAQEELKASASSTYRSEATKAAGVPVTWPSHSDRIWGSASRARSPFRTPNRRSYSLVTGSSNRPSPYALPHQAYPPLAFSEKVLFLVSCQLSVLAKQNEQNTFSNGIRSLFTFPTQGPKRYGFRDISLSIFSDFQTFPEAINRHLSAPLLTVASVLWIASLPDGSRTWAQDPTSVCLYAFKFSTELSSDWLFISRFNFFTY